MVNILEQSTFNLYPTVKEIKNDMQQLGANSVLMSGSGPTVFAVFIHKEEAQVFARKIKSKYNQVFIARTLNKHEIEERVIVS